MRDKTLSGKAMMKTVQKESLAILAVGKKVTILKVAEKLLVDKTFKIVQ